MANIIVHKRSTTAAAVPTAGALSLGELAINTTDGKLFLKKGDSTIVQVGKPAGSSGQVQVNTSGAFAADAGLVYDNTTAGYESLKIGTGANRFLTVSGRVATGSTGSAIQSNGDLAIESMSGGSISIGDEQGQFDGTVLTVNSAEIGLTANTIAINASTVSVTQGSISLGAAAIIDASTATAKALKSTIPAGTGITPTVQIICPSAAVSLASQTATQAVFGTPQDTITLQASTTYMFEGLYLLSTGTVSHTTAMSFVLTTATMTNCTWVAYTSYPAYLNAFANGIGTTIFDSVTGGVFNTANTQPYTVVRFQGVMRVNAAGTLVPNIAFGTAPGGTNTTMIGSYLKFYPIGSNTISHVGSAIG